MLLLTAAVLGTTGCALAPSPMIQVVDSRMGEVTDEGMVIFFDVDVINPSDQPYDLREVQYELRVDGRSIYRGRRAPLATLMADGAQRMELPTVIRFEQMGRTGGGVPHELNYQLSGTMLYIAPGHIAEVLLDVGARRPRVRFSETGRLHMHGAE